MAKPCIGSTAANDWTMLALALVSILSGGLPTYKKGWIALRHRNLQPSTR